MPLTRTHTRTYNVRVFANPFLRCLRCGDWVDGYLDKPDGPLIVSPCEHEPGYIDACPSWGPVDGCTCQPGTHPMRSPEPGDNRRYTPDIPFPARSGGRRHR